MENTEESDRLTKKYLSKKLIEEIEIDINQVHRMVAQSENHLRSARLALVADKEGAYVLLYDAARKGLMAILYLQGIRPTSFGGHSIILEVLIPQCSAHEIALIRPFNRLRKIRNSVEYPRNALSELDEDSLQEDLKKAERIVEWAKSMI